jgi:hypothetical protein
VTIRKIDPYHSGWWFQPTPLKIYKKYEFVRLFHI